MYNVYANKYFTYMYTSGNFTFIISVGWTIFLICARDAQIPKLSRALNEYSLSLSTKEVLLLFSFRNTFKKMRRQTFNSTK